MSRRYQMALRNQLPIFRSIDQDLLKQYENFTQNPEYPIISKPQQQDLKQYRPNKKQRKKLINQQREMMWDNSYCKDSIPVRQRVFIKPQPPKTKKKNNSITRVEKPWYIFDEVQQRRNFHTRVIKRSEHEQTNSNPKMLSRTIDYGETREKKIQNNKDLQMRSLQKERKKQSQDIDRLGKKKKTQQSDLIKVDQYEAVNRDKLIEKKPVKDRFYFSSQKQRKKLGPIIRKNQINPEIQLIQQAQGPIKEERNHRTFKNPINQPKTTQKESLIKTVQRKELYSTIIQAYTLNYVPETNQREPTEQKQNHPSQLKQSEIKIQQSGTNVGINENQDVDDNKPPQNEKQKQKIMKQIQESTSSNKQISPIHSQILSNLLGKQFQPDTLQIVKDDIINLQKSKTLKIDKDLEMAIEEREALIDELRQLLSKGEQTEEQAQILISLVAQYRQSTLQVVKELQQWDIKSKIQYVWEDQIYANKIGNDLLFWGQDLEDGQFDPFLTNWGCEHLDLDLKQRIEAAQKYLIGKQKSINKNE